MTEESFVALDLETTGLSPEHCQIIEVGAVRIRNRRVTGKFSALIRQEEPLPQVITELTGITDEMLRSGGERERVMEAFLEFLGEDVILGHNVVFDFSFLKNYYEQRKAEFNPKGLDTLKIARILHPELSSKNLASMCGLYGIHNERAHRAYEDAITAAMLYLKMKDRFVGERPEVFLPSAFTWKKKKQSPQTPAQKKYLNHWENCHNIELYELLQKLGKDKTEALTRSEASYVIDKMILQFGRAVRPENR